MSRRWNASVVATFFRVLARNRATGTGRLAQVNASSRPRCRSPITLLVVLSQIVADEPAEFSRRPPVFLQHRRAKDRVPAPRRRVQPLRLQEVADERHAEVVRPALV